MRGKVAAFAVVPITAALLVPAVGRAVTINACLAGKLSDVGKSTAAHLACAARDAAEPNAMMLAACRARVDDRFEGGTDTTAGRFARRELRPPCLTVGDQGTAARRIATYANGVASAVVKSTSANQCDATKLTCVGRYVAATHGCLARAAATTGTLDVACLARQRARLDACLGRAAGRGPCTVSGDGAALGAGADAFAAQTLCALDPQGATGCAALPMPLPTPTRTATPVATRTPTPVPTGNPNDVEQSCVDGINAYRASIGRAPLQRWSAAEACAEDEGFSDAQSQTPHSAFGRCGEYAQNECPGWPGPPSTMIGTCLQAMWNEGPGSDFATHGHYINMSNPGYTRVACGFAVLSNGKVWAVQDFR